MIMQAEIPRILIAGTHSGCGKTTIASGLMAALVAPRQPISPSYDLRIVSKNPSRTSPL
jgi:uridine kinase